MAAIWAAFSKKPYLDSQLLSELQRLAEWCHQRNLDCRSIEPRMLKRRIHLIQYLSKVFIGLLSLLQVSSVIKACWYGSEGMALALACSELKISCTDIQHGIAGGFKHRAYYCWTKFPASGYQMMPNHFWCWTEEDSQQVTANNSSMAAYPNLISTTLGIPFINAYSNNIVVRDVFDKNPGYIILKELAANATQTCLVTLQGPYIPDIVMQLIIEASPQTYWLLRPHPAHNIKLHQNLLVLSVLHNVDLCRTAAIPLIQALSLADIHITEYSASYFEANQAGVPTVFVSEIALYYFGDQIHSGQARYASSANELRALIAISSKHSFLDI